MIGQFLIIDNGAYNIKIGFNHNDKEEKSIIKVHNAMMKTRDGVIHIGNEYLKQTNNYSGIMIKRPIEYENLISWELEKLIWNQSFNAISPNKEIDPSETNLILTESPMLLRQISMNTDQIIFEEYGFSNYYKCIPMSLANWSFNSFEDNSSMTNSNKAKNKNDFMLVVDFGFSSTWIVPMIYLMVHWEGVRKLSVGGNLLNGILRETISLRHYDLFDEPILINTIKEMTCFVDILPYEFQKERNKNKCFFFLPDFKTTSTGYISEKKLKIEDDVQCLNLTTERTRIPETYFHPEMMFCDSASSKSTLIQNGVFKNLTDLMVESIMNLPEIIRPLLLANICITGGSSLFLGLKERLILELTKLLPLSWIVNVRDLKILNDEISWYGGLNLSNDDVINKIKISKNDYFENGFNWTQKKFKNCYQQNV